MSSSNAHWLGLSSLLEERHANDSAQRCQTVGNFSDCLRTVHHLWQTQLELGNATSTRAHLAIVTELIDVEQNTGFDLLESVQQHFPACMQLSSLASEEAATTRLRLKALTLTCPCRVKLRKTRPQVQ